MSDLATAARALFEGVMAPLVLGGDVRPGHALGARTALSLTQAAGTEAVDAALFDRVQQGRVRRARRLVPIDALPPPTDAEWALGAALHDVLAAANPTFDGALRRSMARRILDLAVATLDRVPPPRTPGEALSRHTWLARVPDVQRTDTRVAWWAGSRIYRGTSPPGRLQAWSGVRRVTVIAKRHALLDLEPLAVDRDRLTDAVALLLDRSPLTALATCARSAPTFAWSGGSLALVATPAGRALALRALDRGSDDATDAALGRATRELLERRRDLAAPAIGLLAERAIAAASRRASTDVAATGSFDATFARALGASEAAARLEAGPPGWTDPDRRRLVQALRARADGQAGQAAAALRRGAA